MQNADLSRELGKGFDKNSKEFSKLSTRQSLSSSTSSLSSGSENPMVPKPPIDHKPDTSHNVSSRQRLYARQINSNNSNMESMERRLSLDKSKSKFEEKKTNDHDIMDLLNTAPSIRPISSRLSKYSALPQIGAKLNYSSPSRPSSCISTNDSNDSSNNDVYDENNSETLLIGIRMADGTKKQKKFYRNDKLRTVLNFALQDTPNHNSNNFTLLQMPNLVIDKLDETLNYYKIENRSMLFVIDKKSISFS